MSDTAFSQSMKAALETARTMKSDGASNEDIYESLEKTIRLAWPVVREWKYLCQRCGDVGLAMAECGGDATCGREQPHLWHEYGVPCWCSAGERFKTPVRPQDDFTAAGKSTPKPKQFTRFGR